MEGVAAKKAMLDRYNEIAINYSDETAEEMAQLQDEIDAQNLWELDAQVDLAMEALALPARRLPSSTSSRAASGGGWRSAGCCCDQPELLLLDEPTNHLDAESVLLAGGAPAGLSGRDPDRHPRPLLPGQCHRLDLELDRGRGIPYQGNYSAWLGQKQKRLEQEGTRGGGAPADARPRAGVDRGFAQARQAKSKARYQRYEELVKQAALRRSPTSVAYPSGSTAMSGARPAASAARRTRSSRVAASSSSRMPKAMLSATVAENRNASWGA